MAYSATMESKRSLRVLIVEDQVLMADAVEATLQLEFPDGEFHRVLTVTRAIEQLSTLHFNLVISDYDLNDTKTGIDLWRACRVNHPNTAFLLLSGSRKENVFNAISAGENSPDFLPKPFDPGLFIRTIRRLVSE